MDNFLMKPKIDFAFKELMTDAEIRIGFLCAVLSLKPQEIKHTDILNTYLKKEHEDDKQGILDVRISMNDDTEIDIEIQVAKFPSWQARSLFYWSKMYSEQIQSGQDYDTLKKCISISILDFELLPINNFYSCYHLAEDTDHSIYTDKIEFHVIELPKIPEELKNDNLILLWAKFLNAERKEEFEMIAKKDAYIEKAYQHLQVISQDKEKRLEYETREKAIRDYNFLIKKSKEEGLEKGRMEGRMEGEKIGEERISKLYSLLLQNKRYEDLERSTKDYEFQKQLMREYGIINN